MRRRISEATLDVSDRRMGRIWARTGVRTLVGRLRLTRWRGDGGIASARRVGGDVSHPPVPSIAEAVSHEEVEVRWVGCRVV